jgi:hypothetical protein
MKKMQIKIQILIVVSLIFTSVNFIKCTKENNPGTNSTKLDALSLSHSMKGWELYSWPNGNDWNYSFLIGTNRLKTYNEVTTNKIVVIGKDSLKMLLDKFPVEENIFWVSEEWLYRIWQDNYGNLSLPESNTVNEIKNYCNQKELVLVVSN